MKYINERNSFFEPFPTKYDVDDGLVKGLSLRRLGIVITFVLLMALLIGGSYIRSAFTTPASSLMPFNKNISKQITPIKTDEQTNGNNNNSSDIQTSSSNLGQRKAINALTTYGNKESTNNSAASNTVSTPGPMVDFENGSIPTIPVDPMDGSGGIIDDTVTSDPTPPSTPDCGCQPVDTVVDSVTQLLPSVSN